MTRRSLNQDFFLPILILGLITLSFGLSAAPTGNCTSGTQYCEDNGLTTINTTVTTNTNTNNNTCLLYTSPSPRDRSLSRMPSSA